LSILSAETPERDIRSVSSRYVVISPCRNEEEYLEHTLESVLAQTLRPTAWIIVDDGSTDSTPAILSDYATRYEFIRVVHKPDRGHRSVGPGVVEAFYAGLQTVELRQFDFLCKLDLDLVLPPRYFEILLSRMAANPRLGTCSGKPYYRHPKTGKLVSEGIGDEMSIGAAKLYRTECFRQIGGFVRSIMWDGIDCHRCRMLGWIARSWDEPELRILHLRPMGSSHRGILAGRFRHGAGQYFMGTSPLYITASSLFRMTRPPYIAGGLAIWLGYFHSMLTCKPRYNDIKFRRFLRRYQWQCLLRGKKEATRRLDERQATIWNPRQAVASPGLLTP